MIHRIKAIARPLLYCLLASTAIRVLGGGLTVALAAVLAAPPATHAQVVGQYTVANCQSDTNGYSHRAFSKFAHVGMQITIGCNPKGHGLRGLVTRNKVRNGRVKRGSKAQVTITAPPGTAMLSYKWAGSFYRSDCRYALQVWAEGPGGARMPIAHTSANRGCSRRRGAQTAQVKETTYLIPGATTITQRVYCAGKAKQKWCSARGHNYVRTTIASVVLRDVQPPSVQILPDTPLAAGAWVRGDQPLNYTAADNVGVQLGRAVIGGLPNGFHARPCRVTSPEGDYTDLQPCPNGAGQVTVHTAALTEGTQQLIVQAQDAASNTADSEPVMARIDNTAPARLNIGLEGGDHWRNQNSWVATWSNPDEGDRAPIVAASYRLCRPDDPSSCSRGRQVAPRISHLPLMVQSPGEWTVSVWRADAAGNESETNASAPLMLRYDPHPPDMTFEPRDSSDPTRIAVSVIDQLSGLADGAVEIAPSGGGEWQALPTQKNGARLLGRIDDASLPAGTYLVRAWATDRAGNQATVDRRGDGQPLIVTLPLRNPVTMDAGFERTVRRSRKRRPSVVLRPTARVGFGERVRIAGRLATDDGRAIADAPVQLFTTTVAGLEQPVDLMTTDKDGRFRFVTSGLHSRLLRVSYAGSAVALPGQKTVKMHVPAETSAKVTPRRLRNGKRVIFRGRVRGLPVPGNGKLVEIQVRFTDRWQTFRTTRTDALGRWSSRYRFQRTRGAQRYWFRVRLPKEAGYPFETSVSRTLSVLVSGT